MKTLSLTSALVYVVDSQPQDIVGSIVDTMSW